VHSYHAIVFDKDGDILADLSVAFVPNEYVSNTKTHSISNKGKWPGELVVLFRPYCNNYYHWLFDTLPRLESEVCHGESKLYVHQYRAFHRETLRILGIKPCKLVSAEKDPFLQSDLMLISSLPCPPLPAPPSVWRLPVVSTDACRFLRQVLAPRAVIAVSVPGEASGHLKLFIRRQGARAIANEEEVWRLLEFLGFICVALEEFSLAEQIILFSQAEVVVGVHEAGLSNILFCKPGTRVVELMPSAWAMPCYWSISRHVGLDYKRVNVSSQALPGGDASASSSVHVKLDELLAALVE
jgi:capsular polysaccharide biosynthesis protein